MAMEAMKKFPTVIGHSGLDVEGDAKRTDINETSVKVFGKKSESKKLVDFIPRTISQCY